jgi:hypothetical protein
MDNELKWFFIAITVIFGIGGIGMAISAYQQSQCKIEYAKTNRTVAEIAQVCSN